MKVALIGYGKMGHEIEKVLLERGHSVSLIIDRDNYSDFCKENFLDIDVAVEFSTPLTAYDNIKKCIEFNVPVVCGTTAWLDKYSEVVEYCQKHNSAFFYASNYSIGVNVFRKINTLLAKFMNNYPQYEASLEEEHHSQKVDYPSGTAITLADELITEVNRLDKWVSVPSIQKNELSIAAIRRSNVPGTHSVEWESEEDLIQITHRAKGRRGFAMGAVVAAEFLCGKKGVYSMEDLMKF